MPTTETAITPVVQRCLDAYHRELAIPRPLDGRGSPKTFAGKAYRKAMPFLSSPAGIDAFIACVAHGMLLGVFGSHDGPKLLYTAQVAIASRRAQQQAARSQTTKQSERKPTPDLHPDDATPSPCLTSRLSSRPESAPADAVEGSAVVPDHAATPPPPSPEPAAASENRPPQPGSGQDPAVRAAIERLKNWENAHRRSA